MKYLLIFNITLTEMKLHKTFLLHVTHILLITDYNLFHMFLCICACNVKFLGHTHANDSFLRSR